MNRIPDDKTYDDAAEAAMARVLVAEREAREAIEQARLAAVPTDRGPRPLTAA